MKNLTLIVPADAQQALADLLRDLSQISGFTFTHVEAHGTQDERSAEVSARDLVVGYTRRIRVDLILKDADIDFVLSVLRENRVGMVGRTVYWVTSVTSGHL